MANNIWDNSDADNDANNANNWSLGWVPKAGDVMYFTDAGGSGSEDNCNFSGNISPDSINVTVAYGGNIDMVTHNLTTSGNMLFDGTGIFDCGTGTLTCSGNFDNASQTTWTRGTSEVILNTATSATLRSYQRTFYNLTIDGEVSHFSGNTAIRIYNNITINEGAVLFAGYGVASFGGATPVTINGRLAVSAGGLLNLFDNANRSITVGAAGRISGAGQVDTRNTTILNAGTWDIAFTRLRRGGNKIGGGTYGGTWTSLPDTATTDYLGSAGSQTVIFTGDVTFNQNASGAYTIQLATYDPDVEFQGDLTLSETGAGTVAWTKSDAGGTVTFGGTTDYTDTTAAIQVLGDVEITDGSSLELTTEMECDDLTVEQNAVITGAFLFDVGGNFVINGASGNEVSWTGADLSVAGTAVAHWTDAIGSDASIDGGTEITATDNCTDSGANTNWDFGVVGNPWYYYANQAAIVG